MQMFSLKKMGIIFGLAILTSTQAVEANCSHHHHNCHHNSHHSHHRHLDEEQIAEIWGQFSRTWHIIVSDLNLIFSQFALTGVDATTLTLQTIYNTNDIFPQIAAFQQALNQAGVEEAISNNVGLQLIAYVGAAESYANAVSDGGDVPTALANWNFATQNLILALDAIPKIRLERISILINQLQQAQIATINGYNNTDFIAAVTSYQQSQLRAEEISDYLARRILHQD